jgi:hypothetical protein
MFLSFFDSRWHADLAHLLPGAGKELAGFRLECSALRNGDHKR